MNAKHTPGPWHIWFRQNYGRPKSAECIIAENGDLICEGLNWNKNGEVDALILAAAPELLEALQMLMPQAPNAWAENDAYALAMWDNATAAIAKATGKDTP